MFAAIYLLIEKLNFVTSPLMYYFMPVHSRKQTQELVASLLNPRSLSPHMLNTFLTAVNNCLHTAAVHSINANESQILSATQINMSVNRKLFQGPSEYLDLTTQTLHTLLQRFSW